MLLLILLLAFSSSSLPAAQTSTTPSQDPLMSLMLSSPPIDVDSPVLPSASIEPPVVRPGEMATYRLMLNALEQSVEFPDKLPAPAGVQVEPGAHGQMLALAGPKLQPRTCFNFHIRAISPGEYVIPEFKVKVYDREVTVPAVQLQVTNVVPESLPPAPQLTLELPETNLYVGQTVRAVLRFPVSPNSQLFLPVQVPPIQVNGQGWVLDYGSLRQRIEQVPRAQGMGSSPALLFEASLTPIGIGTLSISAQSFVGNRLAGSGTIVFSGPNRIIMPGGPPQYTLLESESQQIKVRPLPREGQLPGFTGAVGVFTLEQPALSSIELNVGDTLRLSVKVRGDVNSNLARLVAPPAPKVREWQIFAVPAENLPAQAVQAQGYTTFTYALIPLSESIHETPRIPFSCFDPERGAYVDLTIPAVPISIRPGSTPADLSALLRAHAAVPEPEKELSLSGLASSTGLSSATLLPAQQQTWFPLVYLAPAAVFAALLAWDRRRRYVEQHPDVVLRRRARHALRRECRVLRRAARRGDAPLFAASAVRAMCVASAPHYPAEPRALVGQDVLELLPEPERQEGPGQTVRRFFAEFDAAQFAAQRPDTAGLLQLKPELERVLQELEAKL